MKRYTDKVIESNEKWFNFFLYLPRVSTAIFALGLFITGIVLLLTRKDIEIIYVGYLWLGGVVFCVVNYVLLKLLLSYQILHIYYLKKIAENGETIKVGVSDVDKGCIGDKGSDFLNALKNPNQVSIPDNVSYIKEGAFSNCTNIRTVKMGDSVRVIGEGAFECCGKLAAVKIGEQVVEIEKGAFFGCGSLTKIKIPDSVKCIGRSAFYICDSLKSVVMGSSVMNIGEYAFMDCDSLETVYYNGTKSDWKEITIDRGNDFLNNATRYYYSEEKPESNGNFWHYVDGVPTKW